MTTTTQLDQANVNRQWGQQLRARTGTVCTGCGVDGHCGTCYEREGACDCGQYQQSSRRGLAQVFRLLAEHSDEE